MICSSSIQYPSVETVIDFMNKQGDSFSDINKRNFKAGPVVNNDVRHATRKLDQARRMNPVHRSV